MESGRPDGMPVWPSIRVRSLAAEAAATTTVSTANGCVMLRTLGGALRAYGINGGTMVVQRNRATVAPFANNAELVIACRNGDKRAWDHLVDRYQRLVYAIPLREGLRRDEAADVTQETFMTLVNGLDGIKDPDRLGYWLMTVARRITWRVRQGRHRSDVDLSQVDLDPEQPASDYSIQALWVYETITRLDDPCRSMILALFFDPAEPSYGEIAVRLGRPLGSVGPLRARCLDRLRVLLEES